MPKGQQRGNRETKKPKQTKKPAAPVTAAVPGGKRPPFLQVQDKTR